MFASMCKFFPFRELLIIIPVFRALKFWVKLGTDDVLNLGIGRTPLFFAYMWVFLMLILFLLCAFAKMLLVCIDVSMCRICAGFHRGYLRLGRSINWIFTFSISLVELLNCRRRNTNNVNSFWDAFVILAKQIFPD